MIALSKKAKIKDVTNVSPLITLSIIWVHFYTPELLSQSIFLVRKSLRKCGFSFELIVVDNGGLPKNFVDSQSKSESLSVVTMSENVGYATGVNRGIDESSGKHIIVLNPDVLVSENCIKELIDALSHTDIVAPVLYLDHAMMFRLPANEQRDIISIVLGQLGQRSQFFARIARRRWRTHTKRSLLSQQCYELSGAMLAFSRETWLLLGPWDAGYKLYFEETEWLFRAKQARLSAAYVPSAIATHLYAQSSQQQPLADTWFSQSIERFERTRYPRWQRALIIFVRNWAAKKPLQIEDIKTDAGHSMAVKEWAYAELSNAPIGFPATIVDLKLSPEFSYSDALHLVKNLPPADYLLRGIKPSDKESWVQRLVRKTD